MQAKAYTVGDEIVFNRGAYQPDTDAGRHTLAHELTHVVQQRSGPVDGTPTGDGVAVSDPGDRFEREAEATATEIGRAESPAASTTTVQTCRRRSRAARGRGGGGDAGPGDGRRRRRAARGRGRGGVPAQAMADDAPLQREGEDEEEMAG